ncbi:hypothetical protein EU527_01840 [Candidatus Thorarchaeota archaeon]|nr:MAG: hypothetical protein EU527_01840 [Candidatus Thorarchaeota archaeon]
MKQKVISFTFLILILSAIFMQPNTSAQTLQSIIWHESIKKDTIIAWKITSVKSTEEYDLSFLLGLLIQMKFVENPPTDPTYVFNTTVAPVWVNMYINGFKLNLTMMGEGASAFNQLVLPITFHYDNGTSFNLTEYCRIYSPFDELERYFHVEGNYLNSTICNETTKLTLFTNISTGIAANVSLQMDEGASFFLEYFIDASNVNEEGESTDISGEYTEFHDDPAAYFRTNILTIISIIAIIVIGIISVIFLWKRQGS